MLRKKYHIEAIKGEANGLSLKRLAVTGEVKEDKDRLRSVTEGRN